MKSKIATLMLIGLVSCSLTLVQSGRAQDNPASSEPTNEVAASASTETPAAESSSAPAAEVNTNAVAPQAETAQPSVAQEAATVVEETPEEKPEEVIPLIQFQDVQLTTAIENLARQAGINYILDPKVGFGQLDERGQPKPQPNISLRWENVTASQALTALLQNHGLQIIANPKTKIARVTIKDPAAPDPLTTRIVQLKFASPSNLVASVQGTFTDRRSKVIADVRTSQLVVLATEKEQDAVEKLVTRLDTQTKQVLIEAKLVETSFNPRTAKGIDWSGTLESQNFEFGNGSTFQTPPTAPSVSVNNTVDPPTFTTIPGVPGTLSGVLGDPKVLVNTVDGFNPGIGFLNADGVSAVLSFLNKSADAKVIAEPRAVTLDNETAHLSVVRAEPIINITPGTANTTGGSQVIYTNLGVILNVTPRISANNFVNLKVIPEVSRLFDVRTKTISGLTFQADAYDVRTIKTSVMIPSGNTLVLGGLVSDDVRTGNTKVPILGDIPILGLAFRKDTKERGQGNLIIFITPTIVGDADYQQNQPSHYLKTPANDQPEGEWSAWDTGKPYDWSHVGWGK